MNYLGIRFFGEFEFWLSSIKVLVIIGLIILSLVLALGGGPDHDRKGFRYWNDPGAFKPYLAEGSWGKFLGFWSSLVTAVFAYLGTELVGVTVGEAQNPRKTIPKAIKLTFYRILVFYVLSIFLLGMIVPYNSDELIFATKKSNSAAASPFVVAISLAGIKVLPGFLNACILIFVFSASNSDLYIASRTLHGLALKNHAPSFLSRTDSRGVPYYALGLSASFCCLAFMNVSSSSKVVFGYFVNLVTIFGLLTWISILGTLSEVAVKALRYMIMPHPPFFFGLAKTIITSLLACLIHSFETEQELTIVSSIAYILRPRAQGTRCLEGPTRIPFTRRYLGILLCPCFLHSHCSVSTHPQCCNTKETYSNPSVYFPPLSP